MVLPVTTDCDDTGAICTQNERMLSNRNELTVSVPGGQLGELAGNRRGPPHRYRTAATTFPIGNVLSCPLTGQQWYLGNHGKSRQSLAERGRVDESAKISVNRSAAPRATRSRQQSRPRCRWRNPCSGRRETHLTKGVKIMEWPLQAYSVKLKRKVDIAEDSMELVTMKNGRHAIRGVAEEDRSINVFRILGNAEVDEVRTKLGAK